MKKKTDKNKIEDADLDFEDLNSFEDDIDLGSLENIENNREPSQAGISKELIKEAGSGFLESLIKKTATKALPESYSANYYTALEYADFIKETFETNKNKINESLYRLGKEVRELLPFKLKFLEKFLEKYESDFEQFKAQTEEQLRESNIQSTLSAIFDKQLEIQKALEAKRSSEEEVEKKERLSLNKINLDILTSIDSNISNQTAFTLQVSKEYYRKSLELQYRSYFIQADMLKTMRDYYKGFSLQFDSIIKNTSLPEFVKLKNTERIQDVIRTQIIQNAYNRLFSDSEYIQGVKRKFSNLIGEKVNQLTEAIGNLTDIISGINMAGEFGGKRSALAGILANLAGTALGEKIAEKISPKIAEKIKDNKFIGIGANYLNLLATSPSTLFKTLRNKAAAKAEEYSDEATPIRFLASKFFSGINQLLTVTEPEAKDLTVKEQSILTHNQPAIFDNKVHRSITEIIPMYLAKILAENTNLRRMYKIVNREKLENYKDKGELVYDYEKRRLTSIEDFRRSVEESVFKDANKQARKINEVSKDIISTAINTLKRDSTNKSDVKLLSNKKLQEDFSDYLNRASEKISEENFTYDTLVTNYELNEDLKSIVDSKPRLREYLEILKKAEVAKNNAFINERVSDIKRVYPILPIKELFKGASKLAESKTINALSDSAANIISKAFTMFIVNTNSDLTIDNIVNGKCFSFVLEKDFEKIKDHAAVFIAEVKRIKMSDDILKESSLEVLLGIVNKSLKDNFEIDPSVFQTLYEYSPLLQDRGKLTVENLVEGRLGKFEPEDFIEANEIKNLSKVKTKDIETHATNIIKSNIISSFKNFSENIRASSYSDIIDNFKQTVTQSVNYKEIAANAVKMFKEIVDRSKEASRKLYLNASEKLNEISRAIENLDAENIVKDNLVKKIDNLIKEIDNIIKNENNIKENEIINFDKLKQTMANSLNDTRVIKAADINIKSLIKQKELEINALEKLKVTLLNARENINNISSSDNFLVKIREIFSDVHRESKKILDDTQTNMSSEARAI